MGWLIFWLQEDEYQNASNILDASMKGFTYMSLDYVHQVSIIYQQLFDYIFYIHVIIFFLYSQTIPISSTRPWEGDGMKYWRRWSVSYFHKCHSIANATSPWERSSHFWECSQVNGLGYFIVVRFLPHFILHSRVCRLICSPPIWFTYLFCFYKPHSCLYRRMSIGGYLGIDLLSQHNF